MSRCQRECREFESHLPHHFLNCPVDQLLDQLPVKEMVTG